MIKILDKIDLSQFEQPKKERRVETYKQFLDQKLVLLSQKLNQEFGPLFSEQGDIKIAGQTADSDQSWVDNQEKIWAEQIHQGLEEWHNKKESNTANITEMAVTLLLDKALGSRFIIARASSFDDYAHGVDNVIVDRQTKTVVCGFDEVIGHQGDDGGEKKSVKIQKLMAKGGAKLQHGLSFDQNNNISIKPLENLPAFYLSLSKQELNSLLGSLEQDQNELSTVETEIMNKFVLSLQQQSEELSEQITNSQLKVNLDKFKDSIINIKELL